MATKEIPITDQDIEYFNKITDAMKDIESRIAALEIAKSVELKEYDLLKTAYNDFASQVKDKYHIPVNNATVDIEKKVIIYDDANSTN